MYLVFCDITDTVTISPIVNEHYPRQVKTISGPVNFIMDCINVYQWVNMEVLKIVWVTLVYVSTSCSSGKFLVTCIHDVDVFSQGCIKSYAKCTEVTAVLSQAFTVYLHRLWCYLLDWFARSMTYLNHFLLVLVYWWYIFRIPVVDQISVSEGQALPQKELTHHQRDSLQNLNSQGTTKSTWND